MCCDLRSFVVGKKRTFCSIDTFPYMVIGFGDVHAMQTRRFGHCLARVEFAKQCPLRAV